MDFYEPESNRGKWYGKYRAFVRDNADPERLGRCRLEVPGVLGKGEKRWSAWASACFPYGGNDDIGMFLVPELGASVWAEFEGGNANFPIWTGVWIAKTDPGEIPTEAKRMCAELKCTDCEDKAMHTEDPEKSLHKKYHGHPPAYCPRVKVLMKTETGHTIVADDGDEREHLSIIDRGGQLLRFRCPIKSDAQVANAKRRGDKSAADDTQLAIKDTIEKAADICLVDLAGQRLYLEAKEDEEKVTIISRNADNSRWQKIELNNTKEKETVTISGLLGNQSITIDSTKGTERITVRDISGSEITMDGVAGNTVVKPTNMMITTA